MMHVLLLGSAIFAAAALLAVVLERVAFGVAQIRQRRIEQHYVPLLRRALGGDRVALQQLAASPGRDRLAVAYLLIGPLVDDRDPTRLAASREVVQAMSLTEVGDRLLRSRLWWRRALALRAFGLLKSPNRTAIVVGALDDSHPAVRGAALDALADLRDSAAMPAIVVRLLDPSLPRRRREAAVETFGADGESFVLALADLVPEYRVNYARALAICGTARARPALSRWAAEGAPEVRAGALSAIARIGLDEQCARVAVDALESEDARVRASAARALRGWHGTIDASEPLARHLDDAWAVAVPAARSLQSLGQAGLARLNERASRPGLAGLLARQMLWEAGAGVAS
jgi:hypothetical protein